MDKRCIPVTHFDMEQVLAVLHLCLFLLLEDGTADKRCQQTYIIEELFHNVYLVIRQRCASRHWLIPQCTLVHYRSRSRRLLEMEHALLNIYFHV